MTGLTRIVFGALAILFATGFGSGERIFAPGAKLDAYWQAHDAKSAQTIDHTAWGVLLRKYLVVQKNGPNLFRYNTVSAADKAALSGYIAALSSQRPTMLNRAEQRAYWINLYNALTVKVVIDHYPVKSIRDIDISPGLFADGPWDKELVTVQGRALTLNNIEHNILRPIWKDPLIHYAVNCASIGCPDLQPEPFTAENSEAVLAAAARAYINSERGVSIRDGKVTISKIYDWFHEDFGGEDSDVMAHLLKYAAPALQAQLQKIGEIHDVAYDWSLNGAGR